MGMARSMKLLGAGVVWRRADVASAGRALVRGLSGGEQERTLAGMALVQAGARSVPLLEDEVAAGSPTKMIVRILADIGGDDARRVLRQIAAGTDEPAQLAKDLLRRHP
jgi:hypothetical protein